MGNRAVVLVALVFFGCDPFAPADPEAPSSLLVRPRAESSDGFAWVLDSALTSGDAAWIGQLLEGTAALGLESETDARPLDNCLEAFAKSGGVVAAFGVLEKSPDVSDTSTRVVQYSISSPGKTSIEGKATWTLASPALKTWKLRRWIDDPAYPNGLHRRCAGGSP